MGRTCAGLLAFVAACSFNPAAYMGGGDDMPPLIDAAPDAVPDAGPCQNLGSTCVGDIVRTCSTMGEQPQDTPCAWGCSGNAPDAACAEIAPSGGWEMQSTGDTTDFTNLLPVTIPAGAIVNTDDGSITGANGSGTFRDPGTGENDDIGFEVRAIGNTGRNAGVFRFKRLTAGNIQLVGTNAVVFIADEGMDIAGIITGVPACGFGDVRTPGPGGFAGGLNDVDGLPLPPGGGGVHGDVDKHGGGGGGYGGAGGPGGNNILLSGGLPRGDETISRLLGGSGGGGGDDHMNSGRGGGGGAAIHLVANGPINITSGGINAGGCGGRAGTGGNDGGGGGGSGGAILIEAPSVTIAGTLAVNGGGGGGGSTGANTTGQPGQLSRMAAPGGVAGNGAAGGPGAAGLVVVGSAGDGNGNGGGGGGGGVGRIRINTRTGTVDRASATLSPGPSDPFTSYSEGTATLR